ncbi:hypothetical protein [Halohasta litorea]|uniref:Uncharacterized protein n=1 Tax=Halohasta litorea TaxID=869891 RepID=A0ABD6DAH5_9EURY|nr:hypothetical protein [Halohasta litorea]
MWEIERFSLSTLPIRVQRPVDGRELALPVSLPTTNRLRHLAITILEGRRRAVLDVLNDAGITT